MVLPGLPQGGRELLSKGPLAPLLCAPCRAGLASLSKAGPIRLEAAMCQLVFRLWLCAQSAPPPQLPKSTHPFTHCSGPSGWQRFTQRDRDRGASNLEPWLWGVGWGLTHLAPSLVPMGQPPHPWALARNQVPQLERREMRLYCA